MLLYARRNVTTASLRLVCTSTFLRPVRLTVIPTRRFLSSRRDVFAEGDNVLLKRSSRWKTSSFLVTLTPGKEVQTHFGNIKHDDIISKKSVRETVLTSNGTPVRIHVPTLAEYVTESPRLVTPIYAQDSNLIVSLLDIHAFPQQDQSELSPPFEILEAGTGHGGLTLHLARAVHAANAGLSLPDQSSLSKDDFESTSTSNQPNKRSHKDPRRAVVHTLDLVPANTQHARKLIQGFKRGVYAKNVVFHTGMDVSAFIALRQRHASDATQDQQPQIFNHIILDLPGTHEHMASAVSALRTDGLLVAFCPSVTQIAECVRQVQALKLPVICESVLELGRGMSAGRSWDVKAVRLRRAQKEEVEPRDKQTEAREWLVNVRLRLIRWLQKGLHGHHDSRDRATASKSSAQMDDGWEISCRPTVGDRVTGGGFLGVWRRMKTDERDANIESVDEGVTTRRDATTG